MLAACPLDGLHALCAEGVTSDLQQLRGECVRHCRHRQQGEAQPQNILVQAEVCAQDVCTSQLRDEHGVAAVAEDVEHADDQAGGVPEGVGYLGDHALAVQGHQEGGGLDGNEGVVAQVGQAGVGGQVAGQGSELVEGVEAQYGSDLSAVSILHAHCGGAIFSTIFLSNHISSNMMS